MMRRLGWPLAILAILVVAVALYARFRPGGERSGDAQDYLVTAHSIAWTGTYGREGVPGMGREPGYPLLLAALMRTTALGGFTPACLPDDCPAALFRPALWVNVVLAMAAALVIGWVAWRLTASRLAATIGIAYMALNAQMMGGRWEVLSDQLALLLVALSMALLLRWWERPGTGRAAAAGLAIAALVLTKAVFLWFVLLAPVALVLWRPRGWAVLVAAAALPIGLWMLRNGLVTGTYALTQDRAALALSSREMFNHLDLQQMACAFVFWTRGFGDDLAMRLFPPEVWKPFVLTDPQGYYVQSLVRYEALVARAGELQGLGHAGARAAAERVLARAFIENPLGWLASMPAMVWRGIWVDEFVVLGFPALIAATVWAVRRRAAIWLVLFALGWFNLLFYAAISVNIPRYQITAVPALALAAAWAAWQLELWRRRRAILRG